jgi:hypothetical protein
MHRKHDKLSGVEEQKRIRRERKRLGNLYRLSNTDLPELMSISSCARGGGGRGMVGVLNRVLTESNELRSTAANAT